MERLRDQVHEADPTRARAADLLRSERPLPRSREREARVRAHLDDTRDRRAILMLRPAVALCTILLAGVASALVGRAVYERVTASATSAEKTHLHSAHRESPARILEAPPAPSLAPTPEQYRHGATHRSFSRTEWHEESHALPSLDALPTPSGALPAPEAALTVPMPPTEKPTATAPPAHTDELEAELVLRAAKALRQDHHPAQALSALENYLQHYPNGALGEEAWALAIESAVQLGDPRASYFANQYLVRFPSGRYVQAAKNAQTLSAH